MSEKEIIQNHKEATYDCIRNSIISAQKKICRTVNSAIVQSYWEIGEQIYKECEENERAEYGKEILKYISERLTKEFGKGFSTRSLRDMRQFYCSFPKWHTMCAKSLTWSHYRLIMRLGNEAARKFYVEECEKSLWSVRQLERQINSFFYERLLVSCGDEGVRNEIQILEPKQETKPVDVLKNTYVLEFLNLKDRSNYHEKDLEKAIIDNLQNFLLELGRGFSFTARQKRLCIGEESFYIDLVFYNYRLKCFVLIDLKIGKITHQDIGQMQMYTNYYKRELMNEGDNQPIGIVLGADKNETVVLHDNKTYRNETFGFSIKSKLGCPSTLLNAGKTTNFIYEISGDLSSEQTKFINGISTRTKLKDRLRKIQEFGCKLDYCDTENQTLKSNLLMIDTNFPLITAHYLLRFYEKKCIRIRELVDLLTKENPCNFDTELASRFYEYKIKTFLTEIALGMTPATDWNGKFRATGGYIIVRKDGEIVCYHIYNRDDFQQYLFNNTKLETPSTSRYDFGTVYTENNKNYIKLNLQIRFL